jgi:hypothetical protein
MKQRARFGAAKFAVLAFAISLVTSWLMIGPLQAPASQGSNFLDTTGIYNGLTAANRLNGALDALLTCNSGSTAPTNALGGVAELGQCWLDTTSATLPVKKRYTGSGWVVEGVIDVSNGVWVPVVGGGSATVASAATTNLCASPQALITISLTNTITSFGSSCAVGQQKMLVFSGILTLTYNATSLIIPGGLSKTTANGDVAIAVYLGSGNWRVLSYVPIAGTVVTSIAGNTGDFTLNEGLINSTNKILVDPVYMRGYRSGLTLSAAGSTATFGVAAGIATDSAQSSLMSLPSNYTKTTGAWTVGSGNGALDAGSIATNTWYKVFEIKRPDTGVVDIAITVNALATGPTFGSNIPAAYTKFRYIGSMKTDGSSQWVAFTQVQTDFIWAAAVNDIPGTAVTTSRVATTLTVPPGVPVFARFRALLNNTSAAATIFTSLAENDVAPSPTTGPADLAVNTGYADGSFERYIAASSPPQIGVRSSASTGGGIGGFTYGWRDAAL